MRHFLLRAPVLSAPALLIAGLVLAQEPETPVKEAKEPALPRASLDELGKLIHKMALPAIPKYYEDNSGWGATVPAPPDLRLPRLRTYIKVDDHLEVPDGIWKKFRIWIDDPAKDVTIRVLDMQKNDAGGFRLKIEADAALHGQAEVKPWRLGLGLPMVKGDADTLVNLLLDVDVKIALDTKKFPPDVNLIPKVVASKLQLKDFNLKKGGVTSAIVTIEGDIGGLGGEIKGVLNNLLSRYADDVTAKANEAIAEGLKSGKGKLSAGELLKLFSGK